MTALPQFMYGDPAKVLEGRERCEGCTHIETWRVADRSISVCGEGNRAKRIPMVRCEKWQHERRESTR